MRFAVGVVAIAVVEFWFSLNSRINTSTDYCTVLNRAIEPLEWKV